MAVSVQRFEAQWSLSTWIVTVVVIVAAICATAVTIWPATHAPPEDQARASVAGPTGIPAGGGPVYHRTVRAARIHHLSGVNCGEPDGAGQRPHV